MCFVKMVSLCYGACVFVRIFVQVYLSLHGTVSMFRTARERTFLYFFQEENLAQFAQDRKTKFLMSLLRVALGF